MRQQILAAPLPLALVIGLIIPTLAGTSRADEPLLAAKAPNAIRIATFNVSLNRNTHGKLAEDLRANNQQAADVAAVIRSVRPDIILLNEIDYSGESTSTASLFEQHFLAATDVDSLGNGPWPMKNIYVGPVNTGEPSPVDVNRNGKLAEPDDSWGYGRFPGQYGMAILSRFEIDSSQARTLRKLAWAQMPHALRPRAEDGTSFYPDADWTQLRLPSKSFWDVPIKTSQGTIHVLASHPTPPAFDGPEDRNGCRNHDEIRLIRDYIDAADYLRDDTGRPAGLDKNANFVVLGDLNSDPADGGSRNAAIQALLDHPRVNQATAPASPGALAATKRQGKSNLSHRSDPSQDTADFNDVNVGNLRVDYVLPSRDFDVVTSGVFWPLLESVAPDRRDTLLRILRASDHHLVWVDVTLPK